MKSSITVILALLVYCGVRGQQTQPQTRPQNQSQSFTTTTYNPNVDSIAEGLVLLAMTDPSIRTDEYMVQQFNYLYKKSKTAWLNNIVLQGNLNEYSIDESGNSVIKQANLYPRYNFGLSVPFGLFINNSKQTKSDYYKVQSLSSQAEAQRRTVRKEVLIYYHDWQMNKKLLALEQQVINDWHIIYVKAEQRFTKGEITLESFYSTTRIYNDELNKEVTLTTAIKDSEAQLEALIGMNIDDAIQLIKDRRAANQ